MIAALDHGEALCQPFLEAFPIGGVSISVASGHGAMISVQFGCGIAEALVRLRAHAFAHGTTAEDVTRDVVTRRMRFTDVDE